MTQFTPPPPPPPAAPTPAPKKPSPLVWIAVLGGVGALALIGSAISGGKTPTTSATPPAVSVPTHAETSEEPAAAYEPSKDDWLIGIKVKEKQCFGSAGCNITFKIDPTYIGDTLPSGEVEVTYKIKGSEDPYVNTFTMDADGMARYDGSEFVQTTSSSKKLEAVVTDVEWTP